MASREWKGTGGICASTIYVMIIIDEARQEEDSDTTRKEGQGKGTDGTNI